MRQWFIDTNEEGVTGPLSHPELCRWVKEGRLKESYRVSFDRVTWLPASALREIVTAFDPAALSPTVQVDVPTFPGYVVTGTLGTGGCGVVYKARQVRLDRPVAIKAVWFDRANNASLANRFDQEAAVLARLQHPNIVQVFDSHRDAKGAFFAMELLEGEDLAARIARAGPFDERTAWLVARQAAGALLHAARQGIFHRDIKPSNLFLVPAPSGLGFPKDLPLVKLTDFGLALTRQEGLIPSDGRLTATGVILGTPLYMAPEQVNNSDVDHRADIFALGATTYHALAGRPPFDGATIWDIFNQKQNPPRLGPPASPESAELLAAMLAADPARRVQTYDELIARIDQLPALRGLGVPAEAPRRIGPRRWVRPVAAAALVAALVTAGVALLVSRGPAPGAAAREAAFVRTDRVEYLFDGKAVARWLPVGGQPWEFLRNDGEKTRVLTGKGGVRRTFSPFPSGFRLTLGVDLFQAKACELAVETEREGLVLRMSREGGAVAHRWIGDLKRLEPCGGAVPFPSAEELEDKAPYLEVYFDVAGGRKSVYFQGKRVASVESRASWSEASVRVFAEQGAVRLDSALQEELRPAAP